MMDRINKRWIVVGVIWAVVLAIDFWNIGEMVRIREARERQVFLKMDEQFLRAHSEEISESLKKREAFFHSAEALNLGLLTVENELVALGATHGLFGVRVQSRPDETDGGSIPVTLMCEGSLRKMVECLEALRRDYAYVPVTRVKVKMQDPGARARCEISLTYRYKIITPESQA